MKKKISLAGLVLSVCAFVAICVCGVYALSTLKLSIAGSITFDSSDCWVKISGNVEGSANHIANYEFFEKGLGKAKTWEIASIDFDRSQNNTIKINLSFENYSYYNVKVTISGVPESNESFDVSVDYTELCLLEYTDGGVADKESATITLTLKDGVDTAELPLALNVSSEKVEEIELSPYFTYTLSDTAATITGLTTQGQDRTALEIPKQIETLPVTAISENSFKDNSNLTRLKMPNTITRIGTSAFENCTNLEEVNIPTSLVTLSENAFKNCQEITTAELPASVTEIGASAFCGCSSLEKATLPETLTTINNSTFYGCVSLKEINYPSTLTTIGAQAFCGCAMLENILIPTGVTTIGASAFSNCISVKELDFRAVNCADFASGSTIFNNVGDLNQELTLTIAEGVQNIPAYFMFESAKIYELTFPDSILTIGASAFYDCSNIAGQLIMPSEVTSIGANAFGHCSSLSGELAMPDKVTNIGESAFAACSNISVLTIPENVTSIGSFAFYNMTGLTKVNYNAINCVNFSSSYVFSEAGKEEGYECVIGDSVEVLPGNIFRSTNLIAVEIGENVTQIGRYAFYECKSLKEIDIPNNVSTISNSAFGYSGIESLTIGEGVTSIESSAFYVTSALTQINYNAINCADFAKGNDVFYSSGKDGDGIAVSIGDNVENIPAYLFNPYQFSDTTPGGTPNLTSLSMGSSVKTIGTYAFYYCSNLNGELSMPESLTSIGAYAFEECAGLDKLILSEGLNTLGNQAFNNCTGLSGELVIPSTVTTWDYAFYNCSGFSSLTISDGVEAIGRWTFSGCSGLGSLTMPDGIVSIGEYAFYNCKGLPSLSIPSSVETIGGSAFSGCSGLQNSIIIPSGVTSIESYTFSGCSGITSVVIPNVTSISTYAFSNCTALTKIDIPSSVTSLGKYAFNGCTGLTEINYGAISCADFVYKNYVFAAVGQNSEGVVLNILDTVEKIPAYMFYPYNSFSYYANISTINIGKNVSTIGKFAFAYCQNVTEINYGAISCADLEAKNEVFYNAGKSGAGLTVNIGENVLSIPAYLFSPYTSSNDAPNIITLNLGENIMSIGKCAFSYCLKITGTVFIPESVTYIGTAAFAYCSKITTMTFESTTGWWYADTQDATSGTPATPTLAYLTTDSTYRHKYWFRTVS